MKVDDTKKFRGYYRKLKPVSDIIVTIVALITTPIIIPKTEFLVDIDKRYAANEPVQTPVNGKGIPINKIRPISLCLFILFEDV